jgi:hypothetical protein
MRVEPDGRGDRKRAAELAAWLASLKLVQEAPPHAPVRGEVVKPQVHRFAPRPDQWAKTAGMFGSDIGLLVRG